MTYIYVSHPALKPIWEQLGCTIVEENPVTFVDVPGSESKVEAWTCEKCDQPTKLELVTISLRTSTKRFRSACCGFTVKPTKGIR